MEMSNNTQGNSQAPSPAQDTRVPGVAPAPAPPQGPQNSPPVSPPSPPMGRFMPRKDMLPPQKPAAPAPPAPPEAPKGQEPNGGHKPIGPIVGVVIIVLVLILGALYFWGARLNEIEKESSAEAPSIAPQDILAAPDPLEERLGVQGASDEIDAIEQDLNILDTTDLEGLDAELRDIDSELGI